MRKIPTLFTRDWDGDRRYVLPQVTPGCEWVIAGEGVPTRKFDGTCMMFDGEKWWARREVKEGKPAPAGFTALGTDPETGKTIGWEPAEQSSFARHLADAIGYADSEPGTYELIGPRINGNPEQMDCNALVPHGDIEFEDVPVDFDGLAAWLHSRPWEGIVWHHPDGRMAKIKKRDFRAPIPADEGDGNA
jgi:Family of unknown function (DUF5565)